MPNAKCQMRICPPTVNCQCQMRNFKRQMRCGIPNAKRAISKWNGKKLNTFTNQPVKQPQCPFACAWEPRRHFRESAFVCKWASPATLHHRLARRNGFLFGQPQQYRGCPSLQHCRCSAQTDSRQNRRELQCAYVVFS